MPRNLGIYTLPVGNPVVSGTPIATAWANTTLTDVAAALTGSIAKDGQTAATANLPMGGFKHTLVAKATVATDYARADQVSNGEFLWAGVASIVGGNVNTLSATLPLGVTDLAVGQRINVVWPATNTGPVTMDFGSGPVAVKTAQRLPFAAGQLVLASIVTLTRAGAGEYRVITGDSVASLPLAGGTLTGPLVGTAGTFSGALAAASAAIAGALTAASAALTGALTAKYVQFPTTYDNGSQAGPTLTIDPINGARQKVTLTGNVATWTLTAPPGNLPTIFHLDVYQDGTGSRTLAATAIKTTSGHDKVLSTSPGSRDRWVLDYDGAAWVGQLMKGIA
jgi:hypothetical protein